MTETENVPGPSILELVLRIAKGELTADQAIEIVQGKAKEQGANR